MYVYKRTHPIRECLYKINNIEFYKINSFVSLSNSRIQYLIVNKCSIC